MKKHFIIFFLVIAGISLVYLMESCKKTDISSLQWLQQERPDGFPEPNYQFADNPLSEEGFQLGRKLFYDARLSVDGSVSCASCHQQIAAFGTYEHDRSHGVHSSHTLRNAPALFNLNWRTSFHWDGAFDSYVDEAQQPLTGHLEMGETFNSIIEKLKADPEYRNQFKKVFNNDDITPSHILKALAQFTGSLVSANSKYDQVKKGLETFLPLEQEGYTLFQTHCANCHTEPFFTDDSYRNTGLSVDPDLNDFGRMLITNKREDSLKFKVPSLRNVNVTSHYMHDGRLASVISSIDHYRSGIQKSETLDPLLTDGISLSDNDVTALFFFLRTLTDSSFITNPRFSDPN